MNRYCGAYRFDDPCEDGALYVSGAGNYNITDSDYKICRPRGTKGHFLVYVQRGAATVSDGSSPFTLTDGGFLLYAPGSPQYITFGAADNAIYYWLHFKGDAARALLASLGLTQFCFFAEKTKEAPGIFGEIIAELQYHRQGYDMLCCSLLIRLLTLLSRNRSDRNLPRTGNRKDVFRPAIEAMYAADIHTPIERFAALCFMSKYRFIHSFTEAMGISPHNYQSKIVLHRAQELLADTDAPVSDIAIRLGFNDVYYFSRFFNKHTGVSPLAYRKKLR